MSNRWKSIWDGKNAADIGNMTEFDAFCELKRADGFDVAVKNSEEYYRCFYNEWLRFYDKIQELTGQINSVYEIGSGSGVNLFLFMNRGIRELGGIDYSQSLVDVCTKILDNADIMCGEAINIETDRMYDLVMSESVFQYFYDAEYAETVLRKMIEKSKKIVYLGEIHDVSKKEELMDYRRKTIADYDENYKGLDKLFLDRKWIKDIAADYDRQVLFSNIDNPWYLNSKYCFNCYIY